MAGVSARSCGTRPHGARLRHSHNRYHHKLKPGDRSERFISVKIQPTPPAAVRGGVIVRYFVLGLIARRM